MKFRDLTIGQSFDFISDNRSLNSFYDRCIKTSARQYQSLESATVYTIGSINAAIYHAAPGLDGYGFDAVEKAISASNRAGRHIGARESKAIHALLRGRH